MRCFSQKYSWFFFSQIPENVLLRISQEVISRILELAWEIAPAVPLERLTWITVKVDAGIVLFFLFSNKSQGYFWKYLQQLIHKCLQQFIQRLLQNFLLKILLRGFLQEFLHEASLWAFRNVGNSSGPQGIPSKNPLEIPGGTPQRFLYEKPFHPKFIVSKRVWNSLISFFQEFLLFLEELLEELL